MIPERGFRGTERGPRGGHNAKVPFLAEDESVKAKRGRKQAVPLPIELHFCIKHTGHRGQARLGPRWA